jgi:Predicted endonuclease distantly related to archaeal Holliday junction resolvase
MGLIVLCVDMPDLLSLTDSDPLSSSRKLGDLGESLAAEFLIKNGYRLVVANFKVPIGRNRNDAQITGEIDLIALDGDMLCFVEVKTRSSDDFAEPSAAVNLRKQRQIIRTARVYRNIFRLREMEYRFDVVSIVIKKGSLPKIELTKAFWNESKFRKKVWKYENFQPFF